jgi:fructose-bisphosphate aldolase class 1
VWRKYPYKKDGTPFLKVLTDAGIIPGIKVDTGAKDLCIHFALPYLQLRTND